MAYGVCRTLCGSHYLAPHEWPRPAMERGRRPDLQGSSIETRLIWPEQNRKPKQERNGKGVYMTSPPRRASAASAKARAARAASTLADAS